MNTTWKSLLAALGATLGAVACSSSTSGPAPGNTAPVGAFINSMAQATCAWQFKCCTSAEIQTQEGTKYTTQAACVPYATLTLQDQLYLERLAVKDNRLTVNASKATACINEQNMRACNPMPGMQAPPPNPTQVDPCTQVFVGATPVGAECLDANECVAGAHCVTDQLGVGNGVCVPYQEVSQICNTDADCDPNVVGLYCAQKDFTCHLVGEAGAACAYTTDANGNNPALPLLLQCDTTQNLYCDPVADKCTALPGAGQACLNPLPPGVSTPCNPNPTLQLVCSVQGTAGGTCVAPGKAGADCSTVTCATGLYCAQGGTTPTCTALPTLGQSCAESELCATPYYCNPQDNYQCDQPATLGQSCAQMTCDTGLYCDFTSETCKAQLPTGATCTEPQQCLSLDCGGTATPLTCQAAQVAVQCTGH